jgi:AraC-like DNA-binding protein
MQELYKKTLVGFLFLLAFSLLAGFLCLRQSYVQLSFLPAQESPIAWHTRLFLDTENGGSSTLNVEEDRQRLRYRFKIIKTSEHPYAGVELAFMDAQGKPLHADLSRYDSVAFFVRCAPANTLAFNAPTFAEQISKPGNLLSYRASQAFFSCDETQRRIELDLTRLETPQWWFDMFKLNLSKKTYKLDKVPQITFGSTFQSRQNIESEVDISALSFNGRDRRYLLLLLRILLLSWGGFAIWFFRKHSVALIDSVKSQLQKDLPFVAYQQLTLEPHRDKEKDSILRFIGSYYAQADLDLDTVVAQTGVNRNKINDILKAELGFTFVGYLNKLRVTEAARLLAENGKATVGEIAYSVGYSNVSYFNKLFKEEYGCTPKAFRSACTHAV